MLQSKQAKSRNTSDREADRKWKKRIDILDLFRNLLLIWSDCFLSGIQHLMYKITFSDSAMCIIFLFFLFLFFNFFGSLPSICKSMSYYRRNISLCTYFGLTLFSSPHPFVLYLLDIIVWTATFGLYTFQFIQAALRLLDYSSSPILALFFCSVSSLYIYSF